MRIHTSSSRVSMLDVRWMNEYGQRAPTHPPAVIAIQEEPVLCRQQAPSLSCIGLVGALHLQAVVHRLLAAAAGQSLLEAVDPPLILQSGDPDLQSRIAQPVDGGEGHLLAYDDDDNDDHDHEDGALLFLLFHWKQPSQPISDSPHRTYFPEGSVLLSG